VFMRECDGGAGPQWPCRWRTCDQGRERGREREREREGGREGERERERGRGIGRERGREGERARKGPTRGHGQFILIISQLWLGWFHVGYSAR
jgi:hypothetical protein